MPIAHEYLSLLQKIAPFLFLNFLGLLGHKFLHVKAEFVSKTLLYLIAPCVFFFALADAHLGRGALFVPVLFFFLCSTVCLVTYTATRRFVKSPLRGILAMAVGSGNTGYFGIPVTLALFGEQALPFAVTIIFGFMIFENTVGFYMVAQEKFSARESVRRLLRLPTLYAFVAGALWNVFHLPALTGLQGLALNLRGAYSTLGMMIIGVAAASARGVRVEKRFFVTAFVSKFLLWPALVGLFLVLDVTTLKIFGPQERFCMILMSIVPLPANSVVFATELGVYPEKVAKTVLWSTGFALFFIPLVVVLVRAY